MIKLHSISIAANLLLLVISLAIPWYVHAEEQELTATEVIHVMPKVTVVSTSTDTLTSTEIIDHELIEKIPSSNGNVTELLDIIPGYNFPKTIEILFKPEKYALHKYQFLAAEPLIINFFSMVAATTAC